MLLRTGALPCAEGLKSLGIPFETLDELYKKCRTFDTFAKNAVSEVKRRAKDKHICYCTDGSVSEDRTAYALSQIKGTSVIDGVSKASAAARLAGLTGSFNAVSAYDIAERKLALPLVVYDVDSRETAGDVKLILAEKFGDEAPAFRIHKKKAKRIPLYEADREELDALVVLDTPLLEKKRFDLDDFLAILRLLRAPEGCPWDRAQTHESIRINAIEEAYELVDAIDADDPEKMREEAGDVIMQAAFHTVMEEERENFTMTDVLSEVCLKLISRHTHVFGKDKAEGADGALSVWDRNKMKEKHQATYSDAVNDVPQCFPALLRAQKIAKRMEKGGWDAATIENFERKFREEYDELMAAYKTGDAKKIAEELGDVLFCTVELGRAVGGECEQALLDTVKKVASRYNAYEALVLADGKDVNALTHEEKMSYYKRAKDAARA